MVYPKNVSILTAPGFKVKLIIHHRPVSTATNRSLLAHRYNFVGNSSGNKEFLPEHPRYHPIALTSIIGATMSFFNRIIGWQRSARLRVIVKLLSRRHYAAFTGVLNASAFCMASLCPSRLSACTHLSLYVIFAMHWPNSGNSNEFYSSDSHPYGIRVRFMNEIDIFKKRIL